MIPRLGWMPWTAASVADFQAVRIQNVCINIMHKNLPSYAGSSKKKKEKTRGKRQRERYSKDKDNNKVEVVVEVCVLPRVFSPYSEPCPANL